MLILTRKEADKIIIHVGEDTIEIRIMEIHNKTIRIGFDAKPNVEIIRGELLSSDKRKCKSCQDSYSGQQFWICEICKRESCTNCANRKSHIHKDCTNRRRHD